MMDCANCGDAIDASSDAYYESIIPVEGSGQTTETFCSVRCLNAEVGFTDEEIKSLMRQEGYEIPPEHDFEWAARLNSEIDSLAMGISHDEYWLLFEHTTKNYDVEIYHDPDEKLYEIVLYTYELVDGEKMGLENVKKSKTGVFHRALAYAERYFESVKEIG